jgi:hypothetical protein
LLLQRREKRLLASSRLSVCLSVCLSVHPHENNSVPTGRIFVTLHFENFCRRSSSIKSHESNRNFAWRRTYLYTLFWCVLLRCRNTSCKTCRENKKIFLTKWFTKNRSVYQIITTNTTEHETSNKWFCTFIFIVVWRTNPTTQCSCRHVMFLRS